MSERQSKMSGFLTAPNLNVMTFKDDKSAPASIFIPATPLPKHTTLGKHHVASGDFDSLHPLVSLLLK